MFLLDATEAARRTRAALGYAGIDVKDSQEDVGISPATMQRIVSPTKPRGFKGIEEAWKIADACGVPREFLEHGFDYAREKNSNSERLNRRVVALEETMQQLLQATITAARLRGTDVPGASGLRRQEDPGQHPPE